MDAPDAARGRFIVIALVFESGLGVLALILGWLFDHDPVATLTWDPRSLVVAVAATAPLAVMFLAFWKWPVGPFRVIRHHVEELLVPILANASAGEIALLALVAGVGEELLFRGFLQGLLRGTFGVAAALAIASVLFGLAHMVTATYAVVAALMGAYLGWLWLETDNILVPIAVHALYDFIGLMVLLRAKR